jgi:hypothetical protein
VVTAFFTTESAEAAEASQRQSFGRLGRR